MRALEAEGLLTRGTPQRGRVGQPSVPMALAPGGALFFGLRIGRRAVEMVLIDFLGTCLAQRSERHEAPDIDRVLRFAQTAVAEMSAARPLAERARIAGWGSPCPTGSGTGPKPQAMPAPRCKAGPCATSRRNWVPPCPFR